MPATQHPHVPRLQAGGEPEAFAAVIATLKRYTLLAASEYRRLDDADDGAASKAFARAIYAELALAAIRAAHGDPDAREVCRRLCGWRA
jgi:hypothetical protein